MKARLVLVALVAVGLMPTLVSAQSQAVDPAPSLRPAVVQGPSDSAAAPLIFGVKAGLNVASISGDLEDAGSKTGLLAGAFGRWQLRDSVFIQPEALISQQGLKEGVVSANLTYLQIPVLALATFEGQNFKPFVYAGPALGIKLASSVEIDGETFDDDSDEVSGSDFSLVFGGGLEGSRLSFDARYMLGLKDIDTTAITSRNRVFSILVGYRFQ